MDLSQLRASRRTTRVTIQLLGRRQRLPLPEDVAEGLHEAMTQVVAEHFEVQPPFTFSNDRGLVLEDLELTEALEAGAIIVAHLSDTAMQELSRRVRQLRNLQWGLVHQHLEKTRVEHAMQRLPGESRPESLLAEQFGELRMELKQTLSLRLERLESSMEDRLRALEDSWEAKLGSVLKEVKSGREEPAPLRTELEGLTARLQAECLQVSRSVQELREECCEAIQREVRARLEHHRNLQEEFKEEVKTRLQVFGRLEREIRELKLEMVPEVPDTSHTAIPRPMGSMTMALPAVRAEVGQVAPYVMEPLASPSSPYPASLQSEQLMGSPSSNPFSVLR